MAKQGAVRLSGRFSPGTQVRLIKVRHEGVLRAEGGEEIDSKRVSKDGTVEFTTGVEPGARYFITGYTDGGYLEVRARGRERGDESSVLEQPPVGPDRVRLSDGSFLDEPPEQHQDVPSYEVGPHLGQHQVPKGVVQRTDTPRGSAHPVDPEEQAPYRRQEDVPDDVVQMQDLDTGAATEIVQSVQRQEETPAGLLQRTDTPFGQAYPIPGGNAVKAQLLKESAAAKESRGEPGRAASEPLGEQAKVTGAGRVSDTPNVAPGAPNKRDVLSGHDAMGQPVYEDVARNVGVSPADKPLAALRGDKPAQDRPDADPADPVRPVSADPPQQMEVSETETESTGAGEPKPSGETDVTKAKRPAKRSAKRSSTSSTSSTTKSTKAKE